MNEFSKRCITNEWDTAHYALFQEHIKAAKDDEDLAERILADERLQDSQGYWAIAQEPAYRKDYRKRVVRYLDRVADKNFLTTSDGGAVKIGNPSFKHYFHTGAGDGPNFVYVITSEEDTRVHYLDYQGSVAGTDINIYSYDCSDDSDVLYTLPAGQYHIYSHYCVLEGIVNRDAAHGILLLKRVGDVSC